MLRVLQRARSAARTLKLPDVKPQARAASTFATSSGNEVQRVPLSYYLAGLGVAIAAYGYGTTKLIKDDRVPFQEELHKACMLPKQIKVVDGQGKALDLATEMCGKNVLLMFGALHSPDPPAFASVAKAAEAASKKAGTAVIPVFFSLDDKHDKPEDLHRLATSSGNSSAIAVTGNPDGLFSTAERFKNDEVARWKLYSKNDTKYKKALEVATAAGYTSDHVYQINAEGRFVGLLPKNAPADEMADVVTNRVSYPQPAAASG